MKNGIKALFGQISYDRSLPAESANAREKRQEARFRRDVFVGMPAVLVIQILPASPLLILLAFKFFPSILPSTIIQARVADDFRVKEALPLAELLKKRCAMTEDRARLELRRELFEALCGASPSSNFKPSSTSASTSLSFHCSELAAEHTARIVAPASRDADPSPAFILDPERLTAHFGKPPVLELMPIQTANNNGNGSDASSAKPAYKKLSDEEGRQRTLSLLSEAASKLSSSEAGDICARLHHDVVTPYRPLLAHHAASLLVDLPATTIKAAVAAEARDSDSSFPPQLFTAGLADYAAAILHDDWLLSRELWGQTGVFEEKALARLRNKASAGDVEAQAKLTRTERALVRELQVICAQRLIMPIPEVDNSAGVAPPAAAQLEQLRSKLKWWLRLSAVIPTPLLLHLTHVSTKQSLPPSRRSQGQSAMVALK